MTTENTDKRLHGKCKWYDKKKGFGIIQCEDNDYFAHYTNINMSKQFLNDECKVHFYAEYDEDTKRNLAKDIVVLLDNKKPYRNTTNFDPISSASTEDMKVKVMSAGAKNISVSPRDVIIIPNMFADSTIFSRLKEEVKKNDVNFKSWHGDTHWIADDKTGNWKDPQAAPVFNTIINKIKMFFNMDVQATRLNWYNTLDEWKPFHHDAAAIKEDKANTQNFTVAISFGVTRDVTFEHAKTFSKVSFEIPDCYTYAFSKDVNVTWKHGIPPVMNKVNNDENQERISIIMWGKINQTE
tara:strand:+ start:9874 stop:10761 length:888 start_codon:yes stop_codon:yes gene_type:complete